VLADAVHFYIFSEDGVATVNQNNSFIQSHLFHVTVIRVYSFLHLFHIILVSIMNADA
jgi:hypothetical protein